MGYTIIDTETSKPLPIRLIVDQSMGRPEWPFFSVGFALQVRDWVCDACNKSSERYSVTYHSGHVANFAWFQVIAPDDSSEDIAVKLAHYARVKFAEWELSEAKARYFRVTGFHAPAGVTRIDESSFVV